MPKKRGHAIHIFGVVAALDEALTNQLHIGGGTLELQPCLFVSGGNRDFREVLLVIAFRVASSIARQNKDSSFFGLRPEAFAAHVGAGSTEDLRTQRAQRKDTDNDGDENSDNDLQLTGDRKAAEHFSLKLSCRSPKPENGARKPEGSGTPNFPVRRRGMVTRSATVLGPGVAE